MKGVEIDQSINLLKFQIHKKLKKAEVIDAGSNIEFWLHLKKNLLVSHMAFFKNKLVYAFETSPTAKKHIHIHYRSRH